MYQTIDDPQDDVGHDAENPARFWFWLLSAIAIGAIFFAAIVIKPIEGPVDETAPFDQEAHAVYIKAVSDVRVPMRRARLQDFIRTYANNPRTSAAQAQLDVINWHDDRAWNAVTRQAYDSKLTKDERLAFLAAYEAQWGGDVLGARAEETAKLKAELMGLADPIPNRMVTSRVSAIPDNIPDAAMLGEPRRVVTYVPPPPVVKPVAIAKPVAKSVIVKPRIRKDRKAKYPRNAQRKKIGAVVVLRLDIDEDGRVSMTELESVEAERYEKDFVKSAERAAKRSRYHPQTVDGEPVAVKGLRRRYIFNSGN